MQDDIQERFDKFLFPCYSVVAKPELSVSVTRLNCSFYKFSLGEVCPSVFN